MASPPITLTAAEDRLFTGLPDGEVAEALRSRGLPTRRTEAWRWSDLRAALREAKEASGQYAGGEPAPVLDVADAVVLTARNGEWTIPDLPDGIRVSLDAPAPTLLPDADLASLATHVRVLSIELDAGFDAPLLLRRLSDGQGSHADRAAIRVAAHGSARLLETHEATGAPFANSLTEIDLGEDARLTRTLAQPETDAVLVHTTLARLEADARLDQVAVVRGGPLVRHEARLRQATGSRARLATLYGLMGERHADTTVHVDFDGEDAVCDVLAKGTAAGRARGVFQGKFHVARGAQGTDAKMAHHALILNQGAQVNAKPELEIYADDVECAHGNTVGSLDAEHLFYLRQRGLSEEAARGVLIEAFAGEVLDRVGDEALRVQLAGLFGGAS